MFVIRWIAFLCVTGQHVSLNHLRMPLSLPDICHPITYVHWMKVISGFAERIAPSGYVNNVSRVRFRRAVRSNKNCRTVIDDEITRAKFLHVSRSAVTLARLGGTIYRRRNPQDGRPRDSRVAH